MELVEEKMKYCTVREAVGHYGKLLSKGGLSALCLSVGMFVFFLFFVFFFPPHCLDCNRKITDG